MIRLYGHIYIIFFRLFSIIGYYKTQNIVSCTVVLVVCFTCSVCHMLFKCPNISLSHPAIPSGNHRLFLSVMSDLCFVNKLIFISFLDSMKVISYIYLSLMSESHIVYDNLSRSIMSCKWHHFICSPFAWLSYVLFCVNFCLHSFMHLLTDIWVTRVLVVVIVLQ